MKSFRTLMMSGCALTVLAAATAEARPLMLAQADATQQTQDQNAREKRRAERHEQRQEQRQERRDQRREERQRPNPPAAQAQTAPPSAPQAQPAPPPQTKLPPVSLPTVNAAPPSAPPPAAAPQAAAPRPDSDRDRRRAERRSHDGPPPHRPPAQAQQAAPAQPAPQTAPQARTAVPAPAAAPAPAPDTHRADRRDDGWRRDEARREAWRREDWRNRRLDDVREQRTTARENGRTVIREPGRTIVSDGNRTIIRHDDTDRLRARAQDVRVERRGADTVTTVVRPDGTRIVSVTDGYDRLVRRTSVDRFGREYVLIDNRPRSYYGPPPVVYLPPPRIAIPRERYIVEAAEAPLPVIVDTLNAPPVDVIERPYSLDEIRQSATVRDRMPRIDVDTINFETGSWMIEPAQAAKLGDIANAMKRVIDGNPAEMFLIEGHTDAVGGTIDNLSLSDRRAESVARVLSDEFGVPPENLQTQGYGEELLKVQTQAASRENRRVAIRRITPLLSGTAQATR